VAPVLPAGTYTAAERGASQASGVLGLSSGQLLEALLVLGALALTGALTRRLTQGSHDQGERGQQAGVAS